MRYSRPLALVVLTVAPALLVTIAYAGNLTPSASPAATSYTLDDLYTRLTTNATATAGNHDFAPSGSPAASLHTLTQVYDAIPTIDATKVKSGTPYLGVSGTLTPDGGTATTAAVFTGSTVHVTDDWTLDTGTLTLACATSTFDGTANKVANAYDGAGNGSNRWCITDTGDAAAGDILATKKAWVDGAEVTGSVATQTLSAANQTVSVGYYAATTLSAVDADLISTNIKSGVTIFGVVGTGANLASTWNGTSGAFTGGSQANGGADDYNVAGSPAVLRYTGIWTQCNASAYNATTNPGGNWCNTGDSGSDAKDNSTGLVWSLPCNGSGCTVLADASPYVATYSWDSSYRNNNSRTASQLCSDHAGWFLPHQKQLMQVYIDGSYGNLEASGVNRNYWSATTYSNYTTYAWYVNLSGGGTNANGKTGANSMRCVRPAP